MKGGYLVTDSKRIIPKDEFINRVLEDQYKRKTAKPKKVRTAMPFKEEIFIDVGRIIKELYSDAVINKDKELIVTTDIGKYHVKVVEKRNKVNVEDKTIKKEVFKYDVYCALLKYYQETEKKEVFFSKEGVIIQRGEADYAIKIIKKKN